MTFLRWLVQLFWIGVCAVAMLWQTGLLLTGALPSGWVNGFVFCATVFGYHFAAPRSRRLPAWALSVAGAYCFFHLSRIQQATAVLPAVIWLFYYDRYQPGRGTGLRHYPVLKPVAIALAWAWVTVLLPLPLTLWTSAGALFVGRAAFIFALALAYDLCDQPQDLRQGLSTLVLQIGPRSALRLIRMALLITGMCCLLNAWLGIYAWPPAIGLALSLVISAVVVEHVTPRTDWGDWRKAVIDGLMPLQLALIWIML